MWKTTYGRSMSPSEMSHRHLSNILWFFEIFWEGKRFAKVHPNIEEELKKRFFGIRLPYQPPIVLKKEIEDLVELGYTDGKLGSDIVFHGVCIGKIIDNSITNEVFTDVDGWAAVHIKEHNDGNGPFWIYDSNGKWIAFLKHDGMLDLIEYNNDTFMYRPTNRTFNPSSQLKQAIRYAYLKTKQPQQH